MKNRTKKIIIILSFSVISIPAMLFPLSGDLSVMFLGGKFIADGAKLYVDFIDIKQPLIYYLLALSNIIFGKTEIAPRIFDYIIQLITAIITFFLVSKISGNKVIAFLASFLYLVLYISLNYSNTVQCESFAGILIILIFHYVLKENQKGRDLFIMGALIGILGGLKITFIVVIFALPLILKSHDNISGIRLTRKITLISVGFFLLISLSHLPLLDSEIYLGFKDAITFLSFYSDFPPLNNDFIRESLKKTAIFFGDYFSILLFFSFCWAILFYLTDRISGKAKKLINAALLFSILLFISVAIERKMMVYHFSRLLLPMAVVSSFGLFELINIFRGKFKLPDLKTKSAIIILSMFFILFSPMPRYFSILTMSFNYFFDKKKYNQMFSEDNSSSNNRIEQLEVINELRNVKKNDFVLVINSGGNIIKHHINGRYSGFGHSCFYLSVLKIDNWKEKFLDELKEADWLVVQKNDRHYFMTRTDLSSYELLLNESDISDFIAKNYIIHYDVKNFIIFRKIN